MPTPTVEPDWYSTLIKTETEIRAAEARLKEFAAGTSTATDAQLWNDRKLVESAVWISRIPNPAVLNEHVHRSTQTQETLYRSHSACLVTSLSTALSVLR